MLIPNFGCTSPYSISNRKIALKTNVKYGKLNKTALIRKIQEGEENFSCFATAYEDVSYQKQCLWRTDCFALARKTAAQNREIGS